MKKNEIKACCGKKQIFFTFDFALNQTMLDSLLQQGFSSPKAFLEAGLFYIEDINMSASGPIGQNLLRVKCKNINCDSSLQKIENYFLNVEF